MDYYSIITWLLEKDNPSIRYRTLTELLDRPPDDPEVAAARAAIPDSKDAQRIFKKMQPDGTWRQKVTRNTVRIFAEAQGGSAPEHKSEKTEIWFGQGTEYGNYATTHFVLAYLAELGFDRSDPRVAKAAERYLSLQAPDGDFLGHFSCLYGYNIRTYILLGYRGDPRVQNSIDLMLTTERGDGGYLCDMHADKYKTKEAKSCIRGSTKTLLAFAELPEYQDHPRCKQLVDYFLGRGGIYKRGQPGVPVNHDVQRTTFPIVWRAGLTEILYALSRMGYGKDARLAGAWDLLESKRDEQGRYILDWFPTQALLKPGKKGEPNKWVTLYALLAKKYRDQTV